MSYCSLDEAYGASMNNQILKYEEMMKKNIVASGIDAHPSENISHECESSLSHHEGTNVKDLCATSLSHRDDDNRVVHNKHHTCDCDNCEHHTASHESSDNSRYDVSSEISQNTDFSHPSHQYRRCNTVIKYEQPKKIKNQRAHHDDSTDCTRKRINSNLDATNPVNYKDIKELLFIIMFGVVILFVIDLIAQLTKKL